MYKLVMCVFALCVSACGGGSSPSPVVIPPPSLQVDCSGQNCGAINTTTYSGSGIGVWKYDSTSTTPIDITINGVTPGKKVTLLFSNGSLNPAPLPISSTFSQPSLKNLENNHDLFHATHLRDNDDLHHQLSKQSFEYFQQKTISQENKPAPLLGTIRDWKDVYSVPILSYTTVVTHTCIAANGRNIVFWVDPAAVSSGIVSTNSIDAMATKFCGPSGIFHHVTTLMGGDAWGATRYAELISDNSSLQDVNIVILNVVNNPGWAGYFAAINNFSTVKYPESNEALAFFIDASSIQYTFNYTISTLIHEATHMINFYQRSVLRNNVHDTWLEETTAMMNEDILSDIVFAGTYNKIETRANNYLSTGGGISYTSWPTVVGNSIANYNMGGAFGSYLSRHYGINVAKQLVTGCADSNTAVSSYLCLDQIIKNNGGSGFTDAFARFGATIFARLLPDTQLLGYGYPTRNDSGYVLPAFTLANSLPLGARSYGSTTHIYQTEVISAGESLYVHKGIVIPVDTTLIVVVQ
jgi:Peptidase M30